MDAAEKSGRSPWAWIPTLYFAQGIPYIVVMTMSVMLYKRLGVSNTDIALYTSWLYLPWVIKPLWSPIVEVFGTKRVWILVTQLIVGAALGCVALTLPGPAFFQISLAFFWLLAFSSATHDIAADGFYMLALNEHDQAWFVGVRSTFFRLAMIAGQGLLIMLAGTLESVTGLPELELRVAARPGVESTAVVDPGSIPPSSALDGELRLVATPAELTLDTDPWEPGRAENLIAGAKSANQAAGFTPEPVTASSAGTTSADPSWWDRTVTEPLTEWLRTSFGSDGEGAEAPDVVGRMGTYAISLSKPPETDIVVNIGLSSGDKGVKLLEGDRLTFDADNWNRHALVVVQLDPKNRDGGEAVFVARSGDIPFAWAITFTVLAGMFLSFCLYHRFALPRPRDDGAVDEGESQGRVGSFFGTFVAFFRKPLIVRSLVFLLFYRVAEAQLAKIASLFLLDAREVGGLAMSTTAVGFVYGTVGVAALTVGGILGGFAAAKHGLRAWLFWMACAINLPNLVYVYLSFATPESLLLINLCVAIEQFGYGFGFAAYMVYMLYVAQGEHKTAHYAICTGFMALGMMIPGMFSGWLQETIGYRSYFVWIMVCTVPAFLATLWVKPDPEFGKKVVE